MKRVKLFFALIIVASIMIYSNSLILKAADLSSYSFVYSFGNAKIWVFIETNESLAIGPNQNSSILLTIYLEELGTNKAVFLNRVTFDFKGTQFEKELSPNVTLDDNARSWSHNIDIEQKDITPILPPGQASSGTMHFEFRYDLIDSAGKDWPYRVNEEFPQSFVNTEHASQPLFPFETIFVVTLSLGIASAMVLLYLRIRKYKKTNVQAHVDQARAPKMHNIV
jgi:hypothetical protein